MTDPAADLPPLTQQCHCGRQNCHFQREVHVSLLAEIDRLRGYESVAVNAWKARAEKAERELAQLKTENQALPSAYWELKKECDELRAKLEKWERIDRPVDEHLKDE